MNLLRNQEPSGGIAFGEVGFIMALWKYGIVALCHYGIVRGQFHNGSFSQMNQLQNLSCFRNWEFRSLGDLESLNDSKTPKLQAAKAMSVRLWHCAIENVVNTHCCQFPIGHWQLELDTGNNGNIPKGIFRALAFLR